MEEKELLASNMILVRMNDAMITTEERSIIGTSGLATCTGVLLYNKNKKVAVVAHVAPANLDAICKAIVEIENNGYNIEEFKYLIIPGYYQEHYNTKETIEALLKDLKKIDKDEISGKIMSTDKDTESNEFAFDASTGKFVTDKVYFGIDYYKINQSKTR